jgi:hypothetical protein
MGRRWLDRRLHELLTTSSGNPLWKVVIPLICQPSVSRLPLVSNPGYS